MKILHLASSFTNGAGTAARRINLAQVEFGLDSQIWTSGRNEKELESSERIQLKRTSTNLKSKALTYIQQATIQKSDNLLTPLSFQSLEIKSLFDFQPDVINLHSMYNLVNFQTLHEILKADIPLVMTLHDERSYTGGCHNSFGCLQFIDGCNSCPGATRIGKFLVKREFNFEKAIMQKQIEKIAIVAPSNWILHRATQSLKLGGVKSYLIPNPIPSIQPQRAKGNRRRSGDIERKPRMIGFCAANINSNFKGLNHLLEALKEIYQEKSIDFNLDLIGRGEIDLEKFEFSIVRSECKTDVELYQKFSDLDLLVVPSLGDNAPSVITEAQTVGTRVIGSMAGGIPEMLGFNQELLFNVEDRNSIKQCIIENLDGVETAPQANDVKFRHSYSEVAAAYSRLYSSLI